MGLNMIIVLIRLLERVKVFWCSYCEGECGSLHVVGHLEFDANL